MIHSQRSQNNRWVTPRWILDAIAEACGPIETDACTGPEEIEQWREWGHVPSRAYSEAGETQPWPGVVWCNPPFGRGMKAAFARRFAGPMDPDPGAAAMAAGHPSPASHWALLVPCDTGTAWGQAAVGAADVVWLPRGRLRFWEVRPDLAVAEAKSVYRSSVLVCIRSRVALPDLSPLYRRGIVLRASV